MGDGYLTVGWIGIYVAVFAIAVSIGIYALQRKISAIGCGLELSSHLVSVKEVAQGAVEILFHGEKVRDVAIYRFFLTNCGRMPIPGADVVHPIGVSLTGGARLLSANVGYCSPPQLSEHVELKINEQGFSVHTAVLNAGDEIAVDLIVAGYESHRIEGRVQGISKFKHQTMESRSRISLLTAIAFMSAGALAGTVVIAITGSKPPSELLQNILAPAGAGILGFSASWLAGSFLAKSRRDAFGK
ncbi:hypothetical protein ACEF39_002038 [Stenotrophomonas indicatrix]